MRPNPLTLAGATMVALLAAAPLPDAPVDLVRDALKTGDAARLDPLLRSGGRVDLHLATTPPARGFHGARQARVLLQERFDACGPSGLESFDAGEAAPGRTTRVARGTVSCGRGGAGASLRLELVLAARDDSWSLTEIRDIDRNPD
jgi:hypothetical protein